MGVAKFFNLAIWTTLLQPAFSLPAPSSTKGNHLAKGAGPKISSSWTDKVEIAQIQEGIVDACILAHAGFLQVSLKRSGSSRIYGKYFPNANNGFDLNNVAKVLGNIIQVKLGGSVNGDCAHLLSQITISPDFPNPDNGNKLSCIDDRTMASMRYARSDTEDPIMIICANALKHGNIGPYQITVEGQNAPAPVTCDTKLVQSQPFGTQDFLTHENVPAIKVNKREPFYGPNAMQQPYIAATYGTWMGDSYAWMASEAMWTMNCGVLYAPSIPNDDTGPAYGGAPGAENYSVDLENDGSWPT